MLVSSGKPRWSRLHQRVVQLGCEAKQIEENELISSIIAPRTNSDKDLDPNEIEVSEVELNAAFELATNSAKTYHFDSLALIVGSG